MQARRPGGPDRPQPHVGAERVEMEPAAAIDHHRHLRRQHQPRVRDRPPQRCRQAGRIDERVGIVGERVGDDRHALDRRDIERGDIGRQQRRRARRQSAQLQAAARGDLDRAVAVRARRRADRDESIERNAAGRHQPHQQAVAGRHRRGQARTGAAAVRRGHGDTSAANGQEIAADIVAARMPQPVAARRLEPRRDRARGGGVLAQQEVAHARVGEIGVVHEIEERARHRAGRLGEGDQPVDGFGHLGGAARAVAHEAGDEARVDGAAAHDPRQCGVERPRPRPLRIGEVEHDQIGVTAERRGRGRKAADEGGVLRAFEQIAAGIVARMHQQVGAGDALREAAGRRRADAVGAAIGVRGGGEIGGAERVAVALAPEQVLDAGAVGARRGAVDARERSVSRC